MALLVPTPFATLIRRMIHEWRHDGAIFDLPAKKWWRPTAAERARTSVHFHGAAAATPFGPAAGPHDQMAQNVVLAYLVGGRIMELKTVQILDELEIGRPCIDAATVGFNIEWSQELKLEEAAEEYVKAAMLVRMLQHLGAVNGDTDAESAAKGDGMALDPVADDGVIYDMSVGYDLKGIQSAPVRKFLATMLDPSEAVERLRAEIPDEFAELRNLDFPTRISDSLTLSTFHGCPPDEIERICEHLLTDYSIHTVVKMNPTMLGRERVEHLVREKLGYTDIQPRPGAFSEGLQFDQGIEMCRRLLALAEKQGVGFGAKFTNTLETESPPDPYLPDKVRYLSGRPLHVVSSELMHKFRAAFGAPLAATFSAGLEKKNVPDTIASGVVPATSCTDMLKTGGYARMAEYPKAWIKAQDDVGATDWASWLYAARGHGADAVGAACERLTASGDTAGAALLSAIPTAPDPAAEFSRLWRANADHRGALDHLRYELEMRNSATYVAELLEDPQYGYEKNKRTPPKIDSHLVTFDCLACDKCIPVCPNDANYFYEVAPEPDEVDAGLLRITTNGASNGGGATFTREAGRAFAVEKQHQIANFADWCNECGNCDTFCPEYDGPYIMKPSFFGSRLAWLADPGHDGFATWHGAEDDATDTDGDGEHLIGRMQGAPIALWKRTDADGDTPAYTFATRDWIAEVDADGTPRTVRAAASADADLLDALWGAPLPADPAAAAAEAPIHDRMSWVRVARALADDGGFALALGGRILSPAGADATPTDTLDLWTFHCARKLLEGAHSLARVTPTTAPWWLPDDGSVTSASN